ncbi:uncharacterized protein LOC115327726 [Ixodes scapularis]|uniref:uncharacterized protein LOC115327726 n=1 Tax=Ixodes scapularis TaxID=6945 RepID=UPI001A9F36D9|nr:uncharacterized protein LOC115327726 [Ixodes scapularis]
MEHKEIRCMGWGVKPSGESTMQVEARTWNGKCFVTANVQQRIDDTHIQCVDGRVYELVGEFDYVSGAKHGLPSRILDTFKEGVPENWAQVIAGWTSEVQKFQPSATDQYCNDDADAENSWGVTKKASSKKAEGPGARASARTVMAEQACKTVKETYHVEGRRDQPKRPCKKNARTEVATGDEKKEGPRPKSGRQWRNANPQKEDVTLPVNITARKGTVKRQTQVHKADKTLSVAPEDNATLSVATVARKRRSRKQVQKVDKAIAAVAEGDAILAVETSVKKRTLKRRMQAQKVDKAIATVAKGNATLAVATAARKGTLKRRTQVQKVDEAIATVAEGNNTLAVATAARKGTLKQRMLTQKANKATVSSDMFRSPVPTKDWVMPPALLLAGSDEEQDDAMWAAGPTPPLGPTFGSPNRHSPCSSATPSPGFIVSGKVFHGLKKAVEAEDKKSCRPTSVPKRAGGRVPSRAKRVLRELQLSKGQLQDGKEQESHPQQFDVELD